MDLYSQFDCRKLVQRRRRAKQSHIATKVYKSRRCSFKAGTESGLGGFKQRNLYGYLHSRVDCSKGEEELRNHTSK